MSERIWLEAMLWCVGCEGYKRTDLQLSIYVRTYIERRDEIVMSEFGYVGEDGRMFSFIWESETDRYKYTAATLYRIYANDYDDDFSLFTKTDMKNGKTHIYAHLEWMQSETLFSLVRRNLPAIKTVQRKYNKK